MTVPEKKVYPRSGDRQTVYLDAVITSPYISVGEYTMYHDFVNDSRDFERNNVLYHYPVNGDRLTIGRYTSIACGARFIMGGAYHTLASLSTYPFPVLWEEWGLEGAGVASAWDRRGDITVGSDVWIGYEAVIMAGVTIGDGAVIGTRALVTRDVAPYEIVGGAPAHRIRMRYDEETVKRLMRIRWWDWPRERVKRALDAIRAGDLDALEKTGRAQVDEQF